MIDKTQLDASQVPDCWEFNASDPATTAVSLRKNFSLNQDLIGDVTGDVTGNLTGVLTADTFRNYIINGDMAIAQRGTSFAAIATGSYCLDRFLYHTNGTHAVTISQSSDVPTFAQAGHTFKYSLQVDCTTANATPSAPDYSILRQKLEGYNYSHIVGKEVTLSFWVKSPKVGVHTVVFGDGVNSLSYISNYTVFVADTWEKKEITLTLDASAGTWSFTTGAALQVQFVLLAGSNFDGTSLSAWNVENKLYKTSTVNCLDNTANNFFITGLMLNEGSVAAPFRLCGGTPAQEELLCKRYCYVIKSLGTNTYIMAGWAYDAANGYLIRALDVEMRIVPTMTVTLAEWFLSDLYLAGTTPTALSVAANTGKQNIIVAFTAASTWAGGRPIMLYSQSANKLVILSAEL